MSEFIIASVVFIIICYVSGKLLLTLGEQLRKKYVAGEDMKQINERMYQQSIKELSIYYGIEVFFTCIFFMFYAIFFFYGYPTSQFIFYSYPESIMMFRGGYVFLVFAVSLLFVPGLAWYSAKVLTRIIYKICNPGENSEIIMYNDQSSIAARRKNRTPVYYSKGGLLTFGLMFFATFLYIFVNIMMYFGTDMVTKTYFHDRSVNIFGSQSYNNEDLEYILEKKSLSNRDKYMLQINIKSDGKQLLYRELPDLSLVHKWWEPYRQINGIAFDSLDKLRERLGDYLIEKELE